MKIPYLKFDGLLNQAVSDFEKSPNDLSACKNCYEYQIGKLEKVPGYSKIFASQPAGNNITDIKYLHYYHYSPSLIDYFIAVGSDTVTNVSVIYAYNPQGVESWAIPTGSTETDTYLFSMATYLDKAFGVSFLDTTGSSTTFGTPFRILGITYSTQDSDLTDMPQGKYVVVHKDLLYVLNAKTGGTHYPSRAYYCDEPTAGTIDWTTATSFVSFGQNDGDQITGGISAFDKLIVFKHFSMWLYDEDSARKQANVGCDSYRSIIDIFGVPYWFNRQGVWRWAGAQPQLVSNKVQKFIDAIDQTKLNETIGVQHEFEYRVFIGDVTVEGYAYTNTWLCFDTRREKWYIRCTYNNIKSAASYIKNDKKRAYFGTDNRYIMKFATKVDEIYDDDGNEIDSFFITNNLDHGAPSLIKHSNHLTLFSQYTQSMKIAVDTDNNNTYTENLGQILDKNVNEIDISSSGYRYRYKGYEKSKAKSWEFEGMVINTDIKESEI